VATSFIEASVLEDAATRPIRGHRFSFACSPENQSVLSNKKRTESADSLGPLM
jgi:hypothetical protein